MILKFLTLALVAFLTSCLVNGQDAKESTENNGPPNNDAPLGDEAGSIIPISSDGFKIPKHLSADEDSFIMDDKTEYIIVKTNLMFTQAEMYCDASLNARLAQVTTEEASAFLVEALLETNEVLDNLWIGLKKIDGLLYWVDSKQDSEDILGSFDSKLSKYFVNRKNAANFKDPRDCYAFGRLLHDQPVLVDLGCESMRGFICERNVTTQSDELGGSTHPVWIPAGDLEYKIFHEKQTHEDAVKRCFEIDNQADLAVVPNGETVKLLGRYMLIGRPSLENAWIGARYVSEQGSWMFESTHQFLANSRQENNYPPWRLNRQLKRQGCVLLDRHISNETLFVEARCERRCPFICSRRKGADETERFIHLHGSLDKDYALCFDRKSFPEAQGICVESGGKLSEPQSLPEIAELIKMMAEKRTTVNHIWIGSQYVNNAWVYSSDQKPLNLALEEAYLIKNTTYIEQLDRDNVCLNLDRENHHNPLIYGTQCQWEQTFICEFRKDSVTTKNAAD